MMLDPDAFRQSMRNWTTGIAIFAAQHAGNRHGMTVSSFTSVSLTPPLVLASIQKHTRTYEVADLSGAFAITILADNQQDVSDRFAGRFGEEEERFSNLETEVLLTGSPLLVGGLAYIDCKIYSRIDLETHALFIGEVVAVQDLPPLKPLVYFDRAYRKLQE